jgi:hypothetical protein
MRASATAAVAGFLSITIGFLAPMVAQGGDEGPVVAYIEDRHVPQNLPLADVVQVSRKRVPIHVAGSSVDLMVGDEVQVARQGAAVVVRILATNEAIPLRQGDPPYSVQRTPWLGLVGRPLAWLKDVLVGANRADSQSSLAASRAVVSGPCYNGSGKTNEPRRFEIPALAADRPAVAAGSRALLVSWRGGAPPFSVILSAADTGRVIAQATGVQGACAVRLPRADLAPGLYRLVVADANGVREEEAALLALADVPAPPPKLLAAGLPEESLQLYAATWLSVLHGGRWAFEAQQQIAAMDCKSEAVQDWLRLWGGLPPCVGAAPAP